MVPSTSECCPRCGAELDKGKCPICTYGHDEEKETRRRKKTVDLVDYLSRPSGRRLFDIPNHEGE